MVSERSAKVLLHRQYACKREEVSLMLLITLHFTESLFKFQNTELPNVSIKEKFQKKKKK